MTEQVRAIRLRPTLSTVLDSATNSDGEIFFDSNNQTLRIFDNGTSALVATRTWTTSSISTAIAAIPASSITNDDINWIPYDQLIDLPSASANHGMFAHVHGTGKAYYAHAGAWIELANASDVADSGLALTDLSVGAAASASGSGAIAYNNTTGVFTYTPPDLSTYLSSVAFSDLTSTPTTVAGYGITDAFDGVFGSLTSTPTTVAGYGITDITTAVTTALGSSNLTDFSDVTISTPSDGQVLKYSSGQWVNAADLTGDGGSGISLSDLSVSVNAAGTANLDYNNTTGVFAYTPPDLSTYLSSVAFSDLTSTPTTVAGYGITDAFDGAYANLTGTPVLATVATSGSYTDLTNQPDATSFGLGNVTNESKATMFTSPTFTGTVGTSGGMNVGTFNSSFTVSQGHKFTVSAVNPAMGTVMNTNVNHLTYSLYNTNATNNGYRFYVSANGGIFNYSGNNGNLSDERTKTNIEVAGSYLQKVCAIPVKLFNYKDEPTGEQRTLGVIAQDVEAVAPEFVNNEGFGETPEGEAPLKSIYTTDITFALMKCIQEQQVLITQQAAAIDDLTARVSALET